jgi:hypothetical protein
MSDRGFFGRTGLVLPAVLAPVAETALVRTLAPGAAGLAPQVTAPPPLDLFHDLRWVSVFHNSWVTLGLELAGVILLRSLWIASVVRAAWPREAGTPPARLPAARRASCFYALSTLLFLPWVVLLFGLAFSHISFLFFAALPPALATAAILHRGAASRAAGAHFGWRPSWRSLAWIGAAFVWLTVAGAVTQSAPIELALLGAAAAGLLNARAAYGVVRDIALRPARRPLPAVVPALVTGVFLVTVGGSALGFALTSGDTGVQPPAGPLPAETPGRHPVLIAAGLHSHYDPHSPLALPRGFVGWRFSYRGIGSGGRPLPYEPADTQQSLMLSARRMAAQVAVLHRAYREPVTLVAESEGALVARSFLLDVYRPRSHTVDRLITLDMPSGVSGVYFPPRGREGWGVASGWGLRGLARLVGALAPLHLSVDSGLGMEFTQCRGELARLAGTPPPAGVDEISFQALADMVDPPPRAPGAITSYLVTATHGGLIERMSVRRIIRGILAGDPQTRPGTGESLLARIVTAGSRPWESPPLPLTLDPPGSCTGG